MSLRAMLRKEFAWSRHRILALVVVLVVLPAFVATSSVVFQDEIPRDSPVAVVPGDESVTEDDLTIVVGQITFFADPVVVESTDEARDMLHREEVYAILEVPPGITDPDRSGTFTLTVDGSIVAFNEPSTAIRSLLDFHLQGQLPADVSVERSILGSEASLSEYLFPVLLFGTTMLLAFTYLPYVLAREADVLDRIRLDTSLERVVGAKLLLFTGLVLVPVVVFHVAGARVGYDVASLAPGAVAAIVLSFLALAAVSSAVMVLTDFGSFGRFVNVVLLFGLLVFSGLVYPVGFFSPLRDAIARALPTHYAMIVTRSAMLKDVDVGLYADMLSGLAVVAVASLAVLKLSIVAVRRRA